MTLLRLPARTGPRRGAGRQPRPRPCLDKIVNTRYASLIALLALNDLGGTQARDFGPQLNHGTYVGAKLGEAGLDGEPCAFFNGNDTRINLGTAAFAADWNGDLYSMIQWAKVDGAARWSDAVTRYLNIISASADINYRAQLVKLNTANTLNVQRRSGAGLAAVSLNIAPTLPPTDWFCLGATFDQSLPRLKAFLFTSWGGWRKFGESSDAVNLGPWGSNPVDGADTTGFFSYQTGSEWIGWGQYGVIWNAALAEREMETVMTPEG